MDKSLQGFNCRRLRCLIPVLRKWIAVNTEIATAWESYKDVPWWNNERSSLSVFAGAVWRSGGFSFEEYSDEKRSILRNFRRFSAPYQGRVDLYFRVSGAEFVAEVKQVWSGCSVSRLDPCTRLKKAFELARTDVRKTPPYGQRRLAILIAMPYLKKTVKGCITNRLGMWINAVRNMDYDAMAWVFPSNARYLNDGKYYCPGAAMMIKEVKR